MDQLAQKYDKVRTMIEFDKDQSEMIRQEAADEFRSFSAQVRYIIDLHFRSKNKPAE